MKALDVLKKWTPELEARIEKILNNRPVDEFNWRTYSNYPSRREISLKALTK